VARLILAAAVLASVAAAAGAASAMAASVSFGTPTASSTFGQGIDFEQPYSGGGSFGEVDIVITYPGSFGPFVVKLDNPGSGSFSYQLDTSSGELQPNTQVVAHFRVTFADGTAQNGPDIRITYQDDRFQWQTKVGKVVRLHWYQGDDSFAQQALAMGEQGIANAATFLGFPETAPVDFYVYADQTPFYDALGPGTRDNVGGEANTDTRTLFALIAPGELTYAATVVPHELTHVVFDDVTRNPYHTPPHWLNEGIAVYVSQGFDDSDKQLVQQAGSDGSLMPLSAIRGEFPTTQDRFYLAYAEAVSAVDYFVRTYGHADLVKLVKSFGTGASDDEAFNAAIGIGVDAFDASWQKANGVASLKSFGPLPAPTGPVPPGWSGGAEPAPSAASTALHPLATPSGQSGSGSSQGDQNGIVVGVVLGVAAVAIGILLVALVRRATSPGGQ
jgi:VCBS repeat-containing protein